MKWDGHTHTHFCKHGNGDHLEQYLKRAALLGFQRYSVTEHPPLPKGWLEDQSLQRLLAMEQAELPHYLETVKGYKRRYEGIMEVCLGLETDYLYGSEAFTEGLLELAGDALEDVVISVHFLPGRGGMRCIDYTPDDFRDGLISYYGSMEAVVDEYYNHVEMAINSVSQWKVRKRLGHIQLIEKFRKELPGIDPEQVRERLNKIVPLLEQSKVGLDVNTAGLRKATCGAVYAPEWFLYICAEKGIPLVYGSDTHSPADVGSAWDWFEQKLLN